MTIKLYVLAAALTLSFCSLAQTKKIAHRSHSGKNNSFSLITPGNFGEIDHDWYKNQIKLTDAKVAITDSTAKDDRTPEGKVKAKKKVKQIVRGSKKNETPLDKKYLTK